jgi:hypothetical protein
MQINNDQLKKLNSMSDDEFKMFISKAAGENGVTVPNISSMDIARIRSVLSKVSEGDPTVTKAVDSISKSIKKATRKDSTK